MGNHGKSDTLEQRRRKVFKVIRSEQWETIDTSASRVRRFHLERRYELPFDPSMMVHFRKRLSGNILKEVNVLIIEKSKAEDRRHDD